MDDDRRFHSLSPSGIGAAVSMRTSNWNKTARLTLWGASACGFAIACVCGCIGNRPSNPAATQPSTAIDLATTQPAFWLEKPAVANVTHLQFQPLWDACEATARGYTFPIDRQDYRQGLLTTKPVVSKQFLEPWRKDAGTVGDVLRSSIATVRRHIRFEIERTEAGTFTMVPKVLIERETIIERRLTSVAQYRYSFAGPASTAQTSVQTDAIDLPVQYWTPIGRDAVMEKEIARDVQRRLREDF